MKYHESACNHLVGVILALPTLGLTVVLYDRLSAQIPTHWNIHGRIYRKLER